MVNSGRYIHTTQHITAQHNTSHHITAHSTHHTYTHTHIHTYTHTHIHTYTHTHIHTTITDIQYIYIPTIPPINGEVYAIAIEAEVYDTADTAVIPAVQFGS
jgi:hypothetical protein